jgi:hypothetical protein
MTPESCEHYQELLTAKALTALDAPDARVLDTHLASCAACRLEMIAWDDTSALLALDARPLEPSTQVRERILAGVRTSKRAGSLADDQAKPIPENFRSESKVLGFERPQRNVWASLGSFGAIAAMVVFAALIISVLVLWRENRTNQRELARLTAEIRETRGLLIRDHAMGEILTSPDGHMAKLTGTNIAPGAHAMLAYDKNGHAMLMAKGLPAAPEGMAYQLWFIKDNKKMPGKVFTTDAAGNGMLDDQIPEVARNAAVFAITLEPKSGVQVPTGSVYLLSAS